MLINYKPVDPTSPAYIADTAIRDVYTEYQKVVDATDEENDQTPNVEPPPEPLPDIGTSLGTLDTSVESVPWDSDNASMLQTDIVWGYVSPEASKSIWNKVYFLNLFGDLGNVTGDDSGRFTYNSPVIGINVYDPRAAAGVATADFLLQNAVAPKLQSKFTLVNMATMAQPSTHRLPTPVLKETKVVGPNIKSRIGAVKNRVLKSKMAQKFSAWFRKRMATFTARFAVKKVALIASLQATAAAASIASAGTAAPAAIGLATMVSAVLEVVSNIMMAIQILLGPVLEQLIDGEGMCPNDYKALDKIIPPAAETAISTFIPVIGDLISLFYPYVCFRKPREELIAGLVLFGTAQFVPALALFAVVAIRDAIDNTPWIVTKSRLEEQPYSEDSTLSVTYASQINPSVDSNGVGIIPPPLENFQVQNPNGSKSPRDWCNFANPIMLDRMANFYYKNALARAEATDDDLESFTYISRFIGVIASSELSCDVVCAMTTVIYDPVAGDKVSTVENSPFYRRFYFIKSETDTKGYFTVTGCTHEDDTAPDAEAVSSDKDANYVPSLPKVFNVKKITPQVDKGRLLAGIGSGVVGFGLQMGGGMAGAAVGALAASSIDSKLNEAADLAIKPGQPTPEGSYIYQSDKGLILRTSTDHFDIDRGAVIERAYGYAPEINFCSGSQLTLDQCTDKDRLRSVIEKYHAENPRLRIKILYEIEPRGIDACYYKWEETDYNPDTNNESIAYKMKEILLYYLPMDQLTCLWKMHQFGPYSTAPEVYKSPRSIPIPVSARIPGQPIAKYPTRRPIMDKQGNIISWVPMHPSEPFYVPRPLPPKAALPSGSCENRAQIEKCITDFNAAHRNRKIENVLKAWTAKPNRCDYLVDMLRVTAANKAVIQRESVSIILQATPGNTLYSRVSDGSDRINSGTFIQDTTPLLSEIDTSGGVLGYKAVINAIQTTFNNIIKPIILQKPEVKLPEIASSANKSIETLSQLVFNNQTLKACPQKKCKDPDILQAIYTTYNNDNVPTEQYEVDVHTMTKILKAGVASDNECDVIFQNQNQSFSDILLDPTEVVNTGRSYRFKLTATGDACTGVPYKVMPNDYRDVSSNAIGVRSDDTTIYDGSTGNIGFRVPITTIDCRRTAMLTAVKAYLSRDNATYYPNEIHTYKTADWSFNPAPNVCEYKVTKDIQRGRNISKDNETYVRATLIGSTLMAEEYNLDDIDIDEDGVTTLDGDEVTLPFLSSYEEKTRSPKINIISVNFP